VRRGLARLTKREEKTGLLDVTTAIGTRDGWQAVLAEHRVSVRGHRVVHDAPDSRP